MGFKVQGLRFKVQGSRFKVQGSRFKRKLYWEMKSFRDKVKDG
jgi:hypothetical protein